jgi:hypothetical protein
MFSHLFSYNLKSPFTLHSITQQIDIVLLVKGFSSYRRIRTNGEVDRLIDYKHVRSLFSLRSILLESPLPSAAERKKLLPKRSGWHLSGKAKILISIVMIAIILVSIFVFLSKGGGSASVIHQSTPTQASSPTPTSQTPNNSQSGEQTSRSSPSIVQYQPSPLPSSRPGPSGLIESAESINSTVWRAVAANAWDYFQPNLGVNHNTGLPAAETSFPYFTDWDLGVYVQSVLDAQKIGLIGRGGDWGADARLDKVMTFLETRELNAATGYPYWFYQASDGKDYHALSDTTAGTVDVVDSGRLLIALNNIIAYNASWEQRVNHFVYDTFGNRTNYAALVPMLQNSSVSNNLYDYYTTNGFASFWPNQLSGVPTTILSNILSARNVTVSYTNVSLPETAISCEPLLCSVFELNNSDNRLVALARQVYFAHEAYYNSTNRFVAYSEGKSPGNSFIYEWVVLPNGDSWKITAAGDTSYSNYLNVNPVIYNKVALSFLALYNTTFARNMAVYLEQTLPDPANGYCDGADNDGNTVTGIGSNTNGLILDAAVYALRNTS